MAEVRRGKSLKGDLQKKHKEVNEKKTNVREGKKAFNKNKLLLVVGAVAALTLVIILGVVLVNSSNKISNKKQVEGEKKLTVHNTELIFKDGITQVKAAVKNNTNEDKKNLSLKITFYGENKEVIAAMSGYVGDLKKGETGNINAGITIDITKAKDVKYEVSEIK